MTYWNNGSFACEKKDLEALISIINQTNIPDRSGYDVDDAYESNGLSCLEVSECAGDIESDLDNIVTECEKQGIKMEFDISYTGDAEGGYIYKNGKYETLNEDQVHLRNISDEDLISEIQRRGLSQKIHDNVVKDFMTSELIDNFGLTRKEAIDGADMAFEYYANHEGATQYDGIEWAADQFGK